MNATLQIFWGDALKVRRDTFPTGDVITLTVVAEAGGKTDIEIFVRHAFAQQLQVVDKEQERRKEQEEQDA